MKVCNCWVDRAGQEDFCLKRAVAAYKKPGEEPMLRRRIHDGRTMRDTAEEKGWQRVELVAA